MSTHYHPFRFVLAIATFIFVGAYLAVCDWLDRRRARKAGAEWEGCE